MECVPHRPRPIAGFISHEDRNRLELLCIAPFCFMRRLMVKGTLDFGSTGTRFRAFTGIRGTGWIRWGFTEIYCLIQPYQSILIPAYSDDLFLESDGILEIMETTVPDLTHGRLFDLVGPRIPSDRLFALGGPDYEEILKTCSL
jgi:hypothetical protein